tara:strand:+ start:11214 stop:11414 length:201 start_codon:yes stop_codon:yes gene_type:complete
MSNPELHVKIDKLICQGTGYCVRLEPEIFVIGDDDLGEVLIEKPDAKYADVLEEAAVLCPTRAITY